MIIYCRRGMHCGEEESVPLLISGFKAGLGFSTHLHLYMYPETDRPPLTAMTSDKIIVRRICISTAADPTGVDAVGTFPAAWAVSS